MFCLLSLPCLTWAARYEYDALNRLTKVTYDNGQSIAYTYDPAGNIIRVETIGRDSATICATKGRKAGKHVFMFRGSPGEAVTLRLEAEPRESGLGKRATLGLKQMKARKGFQVQDGGVLPNEITHVVGEAGPLLVEVSGYRGGYCVTLEASEHTSVTLEQVAGAR
jgi:YD repeat-containing protein